MTKSIKVDDFISSFPKEVQPILEEVRRTIREVIPTAEETISYGIPAYKLDGKSLIYFSGAKKHVGMYPFTQEMGKALKKAAAYDQSGKGTIRFPLNQPMPLDLIREIVQFKVQEKGSR